MKRIKKTTLPGELLRCGCWPMSVTSMMEFNTGTQPFNATTSSSVLNAAPMLSNEYGGLDHTRGRRIPPASSDANTPTHCPTVITVGSLHEKNLPAKRLRPRMPKMRKNNSSNTTVYATAGSERRSALMITFMPSLRLIMRSGRKIRPTRSVRPTPLPPLSMPSHVTNSTMKSRLFHASCRYEPRPKTKPYAITLSKNSIVKIAKNTVSLMKSTWSRFSSS
mmetsp:Transcript_137982/g.335369  ORF Transcript_137982/g.335369 Transcript_137982/m.335369 type:complete len:221 (+) Transcript_137982:911-1573(+)